MEDKKIESIIEAILFAAGRPVEKKELVLILSIKCKKDMKIKIEE